MVEESLQVDDLLAQIHLFQGLTEEQLSELAVRLERVDIQAGERLITEGDPGDSIFIIFKGQMRVSRYQPDGEDLLAVLGPGDYFGEEALLYERPRSASVVALTPANLLRLDSDLYARLVEAHPLFETNLHATAESRQLARRLRFDWLAPGEVIHLVVRKHIARLWLSMAGPVLVALFSIPLFVMGTLAAISTPYILGGILLLIALAWGVWNYFDWGNDYYIVTNQRVVWLERIVALYDSREEAPLRTVLSVGMQSDQIGRILGYGDVIVRTYTGRIIMRNVGRPKQMAGLVEQYWMRTRRRTQEAESDAMEQALRQRLGLPTREEPSPEEQPDLSAGLEPTPPESGFLDLMLANFFQLRYEEGSVITYRKHWFLLMQRIWLPTLLVLVVTVWMGASLLGVLEIFSTLTVVVVGLGSLTAVSGWWLYEFIDWRNDIYQVTADHIVDIDRKPLGTEHKRSAPLENILSLEHERIGILGLVLNFGNVRALVGGVEFTFDGVHDPAQVQQDIFAHMDERLQQKRETEAAQERERMAEWLATYHRNYEDFRRLEGFQDEEIG